MLDLLLLLSVTGRHPQKETVLYWNQSEIAFLQMEFFVALYLPYFHPKCYTPELCLKENNFFFLEKLVLLRNIIYAIYKKFFDIQDYSYVNNK